MIEKERDRPWRRLVSRLLRARTNVRPSAPADAAPSAASRAAGTPARASAARSPSGEFPPTRCFGRLGDREQVALEGFIAEQRNPAAVPLRDPPDDDSSE